MPSIGTMKKMRRTSRRTCPSSSTRVVGFVDECGVFGFLGLVPDRGYWALGPDLEIRRVRFQIDTVRVLPGSDGGCQMGPGGRSVYSTRSR